MACELCQYCRKGILGKVAGYKYCECSSVAVCGHLREMNNMKPDKEGIWEWFEEDGTKRLVAVCNVSKPLKEIYLRVYWWGGYYNVNDEHDLEAPQYDPLMKAEWPDRWGNFVGEHGTVKDEDLYLMPTAEQRKEILKRYENSNSSP